MLDAKRLVAIVLALLWSCPAISAPAGEQTLDDSTATKLPVGTRVNGGITVEGDTIVAVPARYTAVTIKPETPTDFRVSLDFRFAPTLANSFSIRVLDPARIDKPDEASAYTSLTMEASGVFFWAQQFKWDVATKAWSPGVSKHFYFAAWASDAAAREAAAKKLLDLKLPVSNVKEEWVPVRVDVAGGKARVWVEGMLVNEGDTNAAAVMLELYQGAKMRNVRVEAIEPAGLLVPIHLEGITNERAAKPYEKSTVELGGVPFALPGGGDGSHVSLRRADWFEREQDPGDYYENYDAGQPLVRDPRMPMLRVPSEDYTAVHLLAVADDDADAVPALTMRVGRYDSPHGQVVRYDFAGGVPRAGEAEKTKVDRINTAAGPLFRVRIPWTVAFSQDIKDFLDVELTKEIRLARRSPDPCRFRTRPIGAPSGVRIAAITFERSPLRMRITGKEFGNVFVQPATPAFTLALHNVTNEPRYYAVTFEARHFDGEVVTRRLTGTVHANEMATLDVPMERVALGYHELTVTLADGDGNTLLTRRTSLALLPPNTRQCKGPTLFGSWDFGATHFANADTEGSLALQAKLGMKLAFSGTPAQRKKYGFLRGQEPTIHEGLAGFDDALKNNPDQLKVGLMFHETAISYDHIVKVPDLMVDWPEYRFHEKEQKTFDTMWDKAIAAAKKFREAYPDGKISFGNGTNTTREAFWKRAFPAELFDYSGHESAAFARPPEAQPPDPITNNASLWMDRQLLDHYGYKDKPLGQCYETVYVNTNPGNVTVRDQADYYVRHALHGLAWNIPYIRYGMISDVGNSYYYSNWGASGFCNRYPEVNPKPAYVAYATMTLVLDSAKFVRDVPAGSASVYALEFAKPDGSRVWALWTLRGRRSVTLAFSEDGRFELVNDQARVTPLSTKDKSLKLELTPSPVYLRGAGTLAAVAPSGVPKYTDQPEGWTTRIASLAEVSEWEVETQRDPILEFYSMMTPRRKGDFEFANAAEFEGGKNVMRVTPGPITTGKDTMPMYAALRHKKGVALPGAWAKGPGGGDAPTQIGLWVNGNSGWGRVIFELEDSSGQKWTSIGAPSTDPMPHWFDRVVPADLLPRYTPRSMSDWNTEDVKGLSRINFDGWRYVGFPLPGHYPADTIDRAAKWPANSQWRWDKDGVVRYPLKLTRVIVELPEKVLHVKDFAPVARKDIYLKDIVVGQSNGNAIYPTPWE